MTTGLCDGCGRARSICPSCTGFQVRNDSTGLESTHQRWVRQSIFLTNTTNCWVVSYMHVIGINLTVAQWCPRGSRAPIVDGCGRAHPSYIWASSWVVKGSMGLESTHRRWVRQSTKFLTDTTHLFDSKFIVIGINHNHLWMHVYYGKLLNEKARDPTGYPASVTIRTFVSIVTLVDGWFACATRSDLIGGWSRTVDMCTQRPSSAPEWCVPNIGSPTTSTRWWSST